jgi:LmbE family N-acetylglucosaminyl deacetylase
MRILVIAAHSDDEVLGCGATIARLAKEGNEISIALLGEGVTSRYSKREDADRRLIEELGAKAKAVSEVLGAREISFFDLPDNRFDTVSLLDIVKKVEGLIEEVRPDIVFTHHAGDLNIDHAITHRAALTATRPVKGCPVKEVYAFEVPSSTEWAFGEFGTFNPDVFFDIEDSIEVKTRAMEMYESEAREFPHPRSPEAIRNIARRWGSAVGLQYAEAFKTIRRVL